MRRFFLVTAWAERLMANRACTGSRSGEQSDQTSPAVDCEYEFIMAGDG